MPTGTDRDEVAALLGRAPLGDFEVDIFDASATTVVASQIVCRDYVHGNLLPSSRWMIKQVAGLVILALAAVSVRKEEVRFRGRGVFLGMATIPVSLSVRPAGLARW